MLVIVIDPGHGGENLGGEYRNFTEKNMTMVVARAMKEHLEKYDDVTVYLTHEDDVDMSLKERADFAQSVQADFLFCLHFNLSVHHNLFGAEVWVPSTGEYYRKGASFAEIQMQEMTGLGIYSRGIKTKINDRGTDYYGILRESTADGVPSVLIEHCHLDHAKDAFALAEGETSLQAFGVRDAEAVAKYFKLHSTQLEIDYSDYQVPEIPLPEQTVFPDETEPEQNEIELLDVDEESGMATIRMTATDSDSYIQYYMYSLDGGNTYSELHEWPRPNSWDQSEKQLEFTCELPFDQTIELRTAAYNGFDKVTESNVLSIGAIPDPQRLMIEQELEQEQEQQPEMSYTEVTSQTVAIADEQMSVGTLSVFLFCILAVMLLLIILLTTNLKRLKRRNKRH